MESLSDLNDKFTLLGGRLYMLRGNPVHIFERIKEEVGLNSITFEQVICLSTYDCKTKLQCFKF